MTAALLDDRHVRARKSHTCDLCNWPIEPGTVHRVYSVADDGVTRCREHLECVAEAAENWTEDQWELGDDSPILAARQAQDDREADAEEWPPMPEGPFREPEPGYWDLRWGRYRVRVRPAGGVFVVYVLRRDGSTAAEGWQGKVLNEDCRAAGAVLRWVMDRYRPAALRWEAA